MLHNLFIHPIIQPALERINRLTHALMQSNNEILYKYLITQQEMGYLGQRPFNSARKGRSFQFEKGACH